MARRIADAAAAVGEITREACEGWLRALDATVAAGAFFSSITYYGCAGARPSSST